jgi:hypothetical protein
VLLAVPLRVAPSQQARHRDTSATGDVEVVPPTSVPPLATVTPLMMAPESTISVPPDLTTTPLAVPPLSTSWVPPLPNRHVESRAAGLDEFATTHC